MDAKVTSRLDRLLRPRSVAIVGVSPEPGHPGGSVLANLERCRYAGAIHLVSRSRTAFNGRPCVPSIDDLPHGLDVAAMAEAPSASVSSIPLARRRGGCGAVRVAYSAVVSRAARLGG